MKIRLHTFNSNGNLTLEDLISGLAGRCDESGVLTVSFEVADKYAYVTADASVSAPGYAGRLIDVSPLILDEKGSELMETDFEKYVSHPHYYLVSLVVETNDSGYVPVVTSMKHQHFVNFVPYRIALPEGDMEPIEVTK